MNKMNYNITCPVIGIAGWKKSGKTTLAVRLIEEFTRRGSKVASVKHAHHEFQLDDGATDSSRHRSAGSREVAIIGGKRWAVVHEIADAGEGEPNLEEVLSWLSPADLIIVEGYKSADIPKIEARRTASVDRRPLALDDPNFIAIAADHSVEAADVPVFDLDDVSGIADFIEKVIGPLKPRVVLSSGTDHSTSAVARLPLPPDDEQDR